MSGKMIEIDELTYKMMQSELHDLRELTQEKLPNFSIQYDNSAKTTRSYLKECLHTLYSYQKEMIKRHRADDNILPDLPNTLNYKQILLVELRDLRFHLYKTDRDGTTELREYISKIMDKYRVER